MRAFTTGAAFLLAAALAAGEAKPPDPLTLLPDLPKPKAQPAAALTDLKEMGPGVSESDGRVVVDGHIIMDQGPPDGLEVTACLQAGKTHEATILLDSGSGQLIKASFLLALGFADGTPAPENGGLPARGTPVRVRMTWRSPDEPDKWLAIDASCLVRDRLSDKPFPPLPFVYTGSRMVDIPQRDGGAKENFMLDVTKSLVVNYDEPDALVASPFPGAGRNDHRFEVYSAVCPPPKTPVRLVFTRAELPLAIDLGADGALSLDGKALDDAALGEVLAERYAVPGKAEGKDGLPALRAVAVRVRADVDHARDLAAKTRILAAAAASKAWVVPVFQLVASP